MNRTMKIPVMKKVAERLGDIRDEIKEQYDELYEEQREERRRRHRQRVREFYCGNPPATRKERELYIGIYVTRQVFRGLGTLAFTLVMMLILTGTIVGTETIIHKGIKRITQRRRDNTFYTIRIFRCGDQKAL